MTATVAGERTGRPMRSWFAEHAPGIDRGERDVRGGLRRIARDGLLGTAERAEVALPASAALVETIAEECLSSAFSLWAHRMVIEYLLVAARRPAELLGGLVAAREIGSTAMAPALRDLSGVEPLPVLARPGGGGLRLHGPIRWASNLFPAAVVVLPVRLTDGTRAVVWIRTNDPGVSVAPAPALLALNATASSSLTLDGVAVPAEQVLSTDLGGFVAAVLPTFLLLQTAFCAGLATRSLTEARTGLTGVNTTLGGRLAEVTTAVDSVRERSRDFATRPADVAVPDLLRLRLDAAQAAADATRVESALCGGAGYVAHSATSRRLREAAFLAVQAPTEGQLRWELSRFD